MPSPIKPHYKIDQWSATNFCWTPVKGKFATLAGAEFAARSMFTLTKYRVIEVVETVVATVDTTVPA
jgi:hypothetical protein